MAVLKLSEEIEVSKHAERQKAGWGGIKDATDESYSRGKFQKRNGG